MKQPSMRLAAAWATVAAMQFGDPMRLVGVHPLVTIALFGWLLGVILWAAFGVVHEAEEVAERSR